MRPFGSRALVTGGSRGIGLAYVEGLAAAGCDVVIVHNDPPALADAQRDRIAAATGRRLHTIVADVADSSAARGAVRTAAEFLGGLDIVVSNVGICDLTPFLELDDAAWHRHVAVNFHGGFYIGQEAAKLMKTAGSGGRIIFTTSMGVARSNTLQTHYCATKGALHLLAQGMALELGPHCITVNCIAPGWIHTDLNDALSRQASIGDWIKDHCPVDRLGKPQDLTAALLFLASSKADYVNGTTVTVDGGWNAQL